jgi:hypothetical protein
VSSNEPNDGRGKVYGGEEVSGCFVVAGCDGSVEFELGEEVFDRVPGFTEFFIVFALLFGVAFGWNDRSFARFCKRFEHLLVGVEALVG